MDDPGDPATVVDREAGFSASRVSTSSTPRSSRPVPRANTNLTAIMAGELMADRLSRA